ncbi:MAG TPA: lysine--tRNA ligase [Candidatus Kapabacteria bacterium]|nr:lysine--tRNA ligase [Candidatus Kapabacteria bacterium]
MAQQKENNEQIDINNEREIRLKKLSELQAIGVNPYPAHVERKQSVSQAFHMNEGEGVTIAGRIMTKRDMGKLTFCHLQDESGRIQVALKQDDIGAESYKLFVKKIDMGDIISVTGERFVTHAGEQSVLVKEWSLLSKSLLPLPDKYHGLQEEETRYRKRYLDFLVNPEQKEKILVRGRVLRALREFLYSKGFIEVETPVLESVASGAMAKTFDTHLNAYDLPVHLRICLGELWQKRLLVGGFEKTFEMGRAFRNEGVDHQHNPEFTMIEYYWAYADYEDNMKLHEELIPYVLQQSIGTLTITHDGKKIDFTAPYPRTTFREAILKNSKIDINDYPDTPSLASVMKKKGYEVEEGAERGKLLDSLYKEVARPAIIQPTFVLEYPIELKPLAKKAKDPRYTEMFQLIVDGFELSNSYTELNDPVDQRERFMEQAQLSAGGDEEAMANDWDYVEALEHGMPPATGTGIGIDRFVALITGSHTLRETMAFPIMRPEQGKQEKEIKE